MNDDLFNKVKELVEQGLGRCKIAEALGLTAKQASNAIFKVRQDNPELPPVNNPGNRSCRLGLEPEEMLKSVSELVEKNYGQHRIAQALGISRNSASYWIRKVKYGSNRVNKLDKIAIDFEKGSDTYDISKRFQNAPVTINNQIRKIEGTYNPAQDWIKKANKNGVLLSNLKSVLKISSLDRALEILKETFPNCYISQLKKGDDVLLTPIPDTSGDIEAVKIDTDKKKELFTYYISPFKNYMHVKFNDNLPGDVISVWNLTDIHLGFKACRTELFKACLDFIDKDPMAFNQFGGDIYENCSRQSAGDPNDQYLNATEQVSFSARFIAPYAYKSINYIQGNHELRTEKFSQFDSGAMLGELLKLPYFTTGMYIDYEWRGVVVRQFHTHRYGNAYDDTSIKKKVRELLAKVNFPVNVFSSGHTHDAFISRIENSVLIPGRGFEGMDTYIINGGSFTQDTATYSAGYGRSPKDLTGFAFSESGEIEPLRIPIKSV